LADAFGFSMAIRIVAVLTLISGIVAGSTLASKGAHETQVNQVVT
jgi:hypothetical protein